MHSPFLISHNVDEVDGKCCCWQPGPNRDIETLPFTAVQVISAHRHAVSCRMTCQASREEQRIKIELHKHLSEAELLRRQKYSQWFELADPKQPQMFFNKMNGKQESKKKITKIIIMKLYELARLVETSKGQPGKLSSPDNFVWVDYFFCKSTHWCPMWTMRLFMPLNQLCSQEWCMLKSSLGRGMRGV